MTIDIILR